MQTGIDKSSANGQSTRSFFKMVQNIGKLSFSKKTRKTGGR